jgi:hypothetical protein
MTATATSCPRTMKKHKWLGNLKNHTIRLSRSLNGATSRQAILYELSLYRCVSERNLGQMIHIMKGRRGERRVPRLMAAILSIYCFGEAYAYCLASLPPALARKLAAQANLIVFRQLIDEERTPQPFADYDGFREVIESAVYTVQRQSIPHTL